jgi:hypothetical protein
MSVPINIPCNPPATLYRLLIATSLKEDNGNSITGRVEHITIAGRVSSIVERLSSGDIIESP